MDQFLKPNFHKMWYSLKHTAAQVLGRPTLVASLAVTALLMGVRQVGLLESFELGAYDQLMRLRPTPKPDSRLLVVAVTEADIQKYKQWPLSDELLHQLLTKLESYEPRVIGLDIYRDIPIEPGHQALSTLLGKSKRIISVCKFPGADDPGTPPPPSIAAAQVGFSDVLVDRGGIVRRGLLFQDLIPTSRCKTKHSLSFQLAQRYLDKEGIKPIQIKQEYFQLGKVIFKPLESNDGGYQGADSGGFQILLNYRSGASPSPQVTMDQVLAGQVDKNLVKDRVVLIGVTASSGNDFFYTPYSAAQAQNKEMPGIMVHAQLVSQILSAALNQQRLFWFWPTWGEGLWVWGWSIFGGFLAWRLRHPVNLGIGEVAGLGVLFGTNWILFTQAGWLPLVPSAIGMLATGASVMTYITYQTEQDKKKIANQVQEQENDIALLRAMLNDKSDPVTEELPIEAVEAEDGTAIWNTQASEGSEAKERRRKPLSPLPTLRNRYRTLSLLGKGGFGRTYLAEDMERPGKPQCVIKHLRPARQDERFLEIARRLFDTEAEILEKLGHHNQIPQLLAYFEEDQEFYLVEEFVKGHALSEELPTDKRLPEVQVLELLQGILEVLAFIHEHHVIHRDLKPSNIIRRELDNRLVLIDFGAVKQMQPDQAEEKENMTVAIGTRGYTPPEQYAGRPRLASDVYALGMIAIEALTGIEPHLLPTDKETGHISWRHLVSVREEFAAMIEKMVRYHLPDRYKSASEVLHEVKRLADLRQPSVVSSQR